MCMSLNYFDLSAYHVVSSNLHFYVLMWLPSPRRYFATFHSITFECANCYLNFLCDRSNHQIFLFSLLCSRLLLISSTFPLSIFLWCIDMNVFLCVIVPRTLIIRACWVCDDGIEYFVLSAVVGFLYEEAIVRKHCQLQPLYICMIMYNEYSQSVFGDVSQAPLWCQCISNSVK